MSLRIPALALTCILALGTSLQAGITADTPYTNRGQTDFDTALQIINPYGKWSKIQGKWAFTPSDHQAPYTDGRWLYTEYGWYWKGRLPHSWLTEHYGYWKRGPDKVWSWYPGPVWLPEIVEIRAATQYIGWRSAEVDSDGNFVEAPIDRFSKPDEWTFVTLAQFANPITPGLVAPPDVAKLQLEDSTDCRHTYLTYREIDRPGPHPADFADLCKDGGMLAPLSLREQTLRDQMTSATRGRTPTSATNTTAAIMNGTNAPALIGTEIDPTADTRKVKYWITMSLPTFWTPPPPDAQPDQIYLYRPDFYQDEDGIARRITLWFNPKAHTSLADILGDSASGTRPAPAATGPATPAVPASEDGSNPFRSPLVDPVRPESAPHATSTSSKNPVPTGLGTPAAPTGTNSAPAP